MKNFWQLALLRLAVISSLFVVHPAIAQTQSSDPQLGAECQLVTNPPPMGTFWYASTWGEFQPFEFGVPTPWSLYTNCNVYAWSNEFGLQYIVDDRELAALLSQQSESTLSTSGFSPAESEESSGDFGRARRHRGGPV